MNVLLLILPLLAQDRKNELSLVDQENGFSVVLPPGKEREEWAAGTTGGFFNNSKGVVRNKVAQAQLTVDIDAISFTPKSPQNWDAKKAIDDQETDLKKSDNFKEVRTKDKKQAKFPGTGDNAWLLHTILTLKNDAKVEMRMYRFEARVNHNFMTVSVVTSEGEYEKNKKYLEAILANIKTFKVKR